MSGAARRMTRATLAPMTGKIEAYDHLPETARAIREQVFIRERDWRPEFDEWDAVAVHLLAFDGNRTVATCRFYADPDHSDQPGRYVIARLAVLPDAQGRGIGSQLLADAERRIAHSGGTIAAVHSENAHYKFYERRGYQLTDELYDDGRHGWLIKALI